MTPQRRLLATLSILAFCAAGCGRTQVYSAGGQPDGSVPTFDGTPQVDVTVDGPGPGRERCSGGLDEDGDGLVDCADPDCFGDPACGPPPREICGNGRDDDGDTRVDCDDSDCAAHPTCWPGREDCTNKRDDDGDGRIDCDDSDCAGHPICPPTGKEDCANGRDDDKDGKIDCDDSDCLGAPNCTPGRENCSNKRDDDGDGLADCQDPDCFKHPDCKKPGAEVCNNGIDDDSDGAIDCKDSDCAALPICRGPGNEVCDNKRDDDADGAVDCDDPDCVNDPACKTVGCTPTVEFGRIAAKGASVKRTLDSSGTSDRYTSTCAVPGGGEVVAHFSLSAPADIKLSYNQLSGDHVFALFRAGAGEACNANGRGCFDPESKKTGSFSIKRLEAGDYYLIAEAFAKSLEGKVEVTLSTGASTTAENCLNGVDDDGDGAIDCADLDCALATACQAQLCKVDVNIGSLIVNGGTKTVTIDTTNAGDDVSEACAAGKGHDRVIRLVMPQTAGLAVQVAQQGYHVLGLHRDKGPGTVCTADKGSCFDSNNTGSFQIAYGNLEKGVYYFVVDAIQPGSEGQLRLRFRAYANRGPELCANQIDDDGDGLVDCKDPDCAGVIGCPGPVCTPEQKLGAIAPNQTPIRFTADTRSANNDQTVSCALGGGKDRVISLELTQVSGLRISCSQTGDHVLGLFAAGAPRDPCDKTPVNCADLKTSPFGCGFIFPNLQPGKYYLVVEAFKPGAEGSVSLAVSAVPDHAQEICNNGKDDDGDGKVDCQDSNCSGKPLCQGLTCTPDQQLGLLAVGGAAKSVAVTTTGAGDSNSASCAIGGGEDAVVAFNLAQSATVTFDYAQFGNHVIALYSDKGSGFACDAAPLSCQRTNSQTAGKVTFNNVPKGSYFLVIEAVSNGAEGSMVLRGSAK